VTTIAVISPSGAELDRIVADGDEYVYDTGAASGLMEVLLGTGMSVGQALDALASWSNGYLVTRAIPDGAPPLPPIPGLAAAIGTRAGAVTAAMRFDPGQRRGDDGRWTDGGGSGPDEDDEEGPEPEDEHRNVERFPSRYLREYGHVTEEIDIGEADLFVAKTDKGRFHVARGESDREVLIDLDNDKAGSLADFVLLFSENEPGFDVTDPISGANVRSAGNGGVRVDWPQGSSTELTEDGALALQEALRALGPGFEDDD
jgi:hypothetical protein